MRIIRKIRPVLIVLTAILAFLFVMTPSKGRAEGENTAALNAAPSPSPTIAPATPVNLSELVVVSYQVLSGSSRLTQVNRGESVTLDLVLKNTEVMTSAISGAGDIDVSRIVDSFNGGNIVSVTVESQGSEPLRFRVVVTGCVYSGNAQSFGLLVGYKNVTGDYEKINVNVYECVPYAAPSASAQPTLQSPAPVFQISRSDIDKPIEAGETRTLTLSFYNVGPGTAVNAAASLTPSDAFQLLENSSSFALGSIMAGKSVQIAVKLKALKDIPATPQSLGVELKYGYYSGETLSQGSASDKLSLPANSNAVDPNAPTGPVPNIIIKQYGYGEAQVAAGSVFTLNMELLNTGKKKVENIVMSLETGEGLSISTSSNTFFYQEMGSGETRGEAVGMQALPNAKTGSVQITVNFKYEYMDNNKRTQATFSEKIAIPVYQPDRFEIAAPSLPESVNAGEELSLSLPYINKGKSDVYNVQAELKGEVEAPIKLQNLGNFEPGKNGTVNFILTPAEEGSLECAVELRYEDAAGALKSKEIPIKLTVVQAALEEDTSGIEAEMPSENSGGAIWYWAIGGGLVLGATGAVLLHLRKKRASARKKKYQWDESAEEEQQDAL